MMFARGSVPTPAPFAVPAQTGTGAVQPGTVAVPVVQLCPPATLRDIGSIDESVFAPEDKTTFSKFWDKTFFQKTVSEDIYDAIASRSGASVAAREKVRMNGYNLVST